MIEREFVLKTTAEIGFQGTYRILKASLGLPEPSASEWNDILSPLILDKDPATHEWILIASTDQIADWKLRGRPSPAYWQFRFKNGAWTEEPLSPAFVGRTRNLIYTPFRLDRAWSGRFKPAVLFWKETREILVPFPPHFVRIDGNYNFHPA